MKLSRKKLDAISRISVVTDALESVEPKMSRTGDRGDFWWNQQPEMWDSSERELWDLLHETERKVVNEILLIIEGGAPEDKL